MVSNVLMDINEENELDKIKEYLRLSDYVMKSIENEPDILITEKGAIHYNKFDKIAENIFINKKRKQLRNKLKQKIKYEKRHL